MVAPFKSGVRASCAEVPEPGGPSDRSYTQDLEYLTLGPWSRILVAAPAEDRSRGSVGNLEQGPPGRRVALA